MGFFDELLNKVSSGVHSLIHPNDPVKNPIYNMQDFTSPEAAPSGQLKRPENVDNFVDNVARTAQQAGEGFFNTVAPPVSQAWDGVTGAVQGAYNNSFQKTVNDRIANTPIMPFFPLTAGNVGEMIPATLRAPGRAVASIALEGFNQAELTPTNPAEKFVFGDETVKSLSQQNRESKDFLGKYGIRGAAIDAGVPLAIGALTVADLIPTGVDDLIGSGAKNLTGKTTKKFLSGLEEMTKTAGGADDLIKGVDEAVRLAVSGSKGSEEILQGIKVALETKLNTVADDAVKVAIEDQVGVLDDLIKNGKNAISSTVKAAEALPLNSQEANAAASSFDNVGASSKSMNNEAGRSIAGLKEPLENTSALTGGSPPNVTRNTSPSNRTNFVSTFNSITPSQDEYTKYYKEMQSQEPIFLEQMGRIAQQVNGEVVYRLKSVESLGKKVLRKNKGLGEMNDTIASTIVVDDASKINNALEEFKKIGNITKVDDHRQTPTFLGYKAIHVDNELPNGAIAEVQINTKQGLYQKEYAHEIYDKWRSYIEHNGSTTIQDVVDLLSKDKPEKLQEFFNDVVLSRNIYEGKVPVPDQYTKVVDARLAETAEKIKTVMPREMPLLDSSRLPGGDGTSSPFPAGSGNVPPPPGGGAGASEGTKMPNIVIDETGKLRKLDEPNKYQFDLKQLNTPDDVKNTILEMAKTENDTVQKARRGTITWEQTRKFADALGMTTEEVMNRKPGKMYNAEELDAATRLALGAAEELTNIQKKVRTMREAGQEVPAELRNEMIASALKLKGIQSSVIGARSEAGRTLNAVKMMKDAVNETEKLKAERAIKKIFAGDEKTAEKMIDQLGQFDADDTLGMVKFIQQVKPSTPIDMIEEYWYNSVLSNTATHIVNFTGNATSTLLRFPEKAVASMIDSVLTTGGKVIGKTVQRERYMAEIGGEISGVRSGFTKGIQRALYVMKNGLSASDVNKFDVARGQAIKGVAGDIINIPSRALVASDELFKGINYEMSLWEQGIRIAKQEGKSGAELTARVADIVSSPDPKVVEAAMDKAKNRLFQSSSKSADAVRAFRDNLAVIDLGRFGEFKSVRFIIPFIQTPANVVKFGLERSPVGFVGATFKAANRAGKGEVSDQLAKAFIGSAMMVPLAMYFSEDKITGAPPSDPKERDAFYADNKLPYSVKIGDRWWAYNRVEPFNTILSQIAMWHDSFKKGGDVVSQETVGEFLRGTVMNLADQTFMTGLGNLINAVEDPERYGQKFITDIGGGFIPSLVAAGARTVDTTIRKPESVVQDLQARIPLISRDLPARESQFEPDGEAKRKGGLVTQIVNNFTGFRSSPVSNTDILGTVREIKQLNSEAKAGTEQEKADALKMLAEIEKTPKEQRGQLLKDWADSGRLSDKAVTVIQNTLQERALPLKGEEEYLKNSPVKTRAKIIYEKLAKIPPDQRADYISGLADRKILTNDVATALADYVTSQQTESTQDLPLYNR